MVLALPVAAGCARVPNIPEPLVEFITAISYSIGVGNTRQQKGSMKMADHGLMEGFWGISMRNVLLNLLLLLSIRTQHGSMGEHVDTFHLLRLVAAGGERLQIPGQGGRLVRRRPNGRPDGSQFLQCLRVDTAAGRSSTIRPGCSSSYPAHNTSPAMKRQLFRFVGAGHSPGLPLMASGTISILNDFLSLGADYLGNGTSAAVKVIDYPTSLTTNPTMLNSLSAP